MAKEKNITKRNGKGKEYYDSGKISTEGEYLNGFLNGEAKIYNNDGTLRYEAEFHNHSRTGKVKEYDKGILIFEGEHSGGSRTGKGKEYIKKEKEREKVKNIIRKKILYLKGNINMEEE